METYVVSANNSDLNNIKYVGTDIEAAKASIADHERNVYLHVWNGGVLVRKYLKITKDYGRVVQWKLIDDYLSDMKAQAAALERKLSKITEVDAHKVGHKDDGEGGWYLA